MMVYFVSRVKATDDKKKLKLKKTLQQPPCVFISSEANQSNDRVPMIQREKFRGNYAQRPATRRSIGSPS